MDRQFAPLHGLNSTASSLMKYRNYWKGKIRLGSFSSAISAARS